MGPASMSIPRVVLASDDLNARARVLAAADPLDVEIITAPPTGFAPALAGAALLILDLDRGGMAALEKLADVMPGIDPPPRVVGFYSHIDTALADAARAAGCDPIPRGRFWANLPQLLDSVS